MRALRCEPSDQLAWAPNFEYWYWVNRDNGTLPPEYAGLSQNALWRAMDVTIWRRVTIVHTAYDPSVTIDTEYVDDWMTTTYRTPAGELRTRHQQAKDSSKTWFLHEHMVKTIDDLPALRYLIDATQYTLDTADYAREAAEIGDDGIVLTCLPCVPFIQFAKTDVGYENAYYMLEDNPEVVDPILRAYEAKYLEAYRLAAQGPCDVVSNGDNMDHLTCPPHFFTRYAVPFYQQVQEILHAGGKIAQGHWCGKLDRLIPLMPDCGLDVIEAVTPKPMSNLDMGEMMDQLEGKIAIMGGMPSVYMCDVGCTRDELTRFTEELLEQVGHCRGFVLGMGDNVPSGADFPRVKQISEIVARFNGAG